MQSRDPVHFFDPGIKSSIPELEKFWKCGGKFFVSFYWKIKMINYRIFSIFSSHFSVTCKFKIQNIIIVMFSHVMPLHWLRTKMRTRLGDDTVDALSVLRCFFLQKLSLRRWANKTSEVMCIFLIFQENEKNLIETQLNSVTQSK